MPKKSRHPLFLYATEGDLENVQTCLAQTPSVARLSDPYGHTALMRAAAHGRLDCVLALLPHSFPNRVDPEGVNALELAVAFRHRECFEAILAHHSGPINPRKAHALALRATSHDWGDALRALLPFVDVDIVQTDTPPGGTLLMTAIRYRSPDCIRLLLPLSDANVCDATGQNALMVAARALNSSAIETLLPRTDTTQRDHRHSTAFDLALYGDAQDDDEDDGSADPLADRDPSLWTCVDLLTQSVDAHTALQVYRKAPAGLMPRFAAKLEREALVQLLESPATSPESTTDSLSTQGMATPSTRARARSVSRL